MRQAGFTRLWRAFDSMRDGRHLQNLVSMDFGNLQTPLGKGLLSDHQHMRWIATRQPIPAATRPDSVADEEEDFSTDVELRWPLPSNVLQEMDPEFVQALQAAARFELSEREASQQRRQQQQQALSKRVTWRQPPAAVPVKPQAADVADSALNSTQGSLRAQEASATLPSHVGQLEVPSAEDQRLHRSSELLLEGIQYDSSTARLHGSTGMGAAADHTSSAPVTGTASASQAGSSAIPDSGAAGPLRDYATIFQPKQVADMLVAAHMDDVCIIHVRGACDYADYLITATGRSPQHLEAAAGAVLYQLKEQSVEPVPGLSPSVEGSSGDDWLVVDAGSIIVHCFLEGARRMYDLEGMWGSSGGRLEPVASAFAGVQTLQTMRVAH